MTIPSTQFKQTMQISPIGKIGSQDTMYRISQNIGQMFKKDEKHADIKDKHDKELWDLQQQYLKLVLSHALMPNPW